MPPKPRGGGAGRRPPSISDGKPGQASGVGMASGGMGGGGAGQGPAARDRTRSQRWVEFRDDDIKRRERQLSQVAAHVKELHEHGEYGLMSTVGPMLGLLDDTYVMDENGEILGRADRAAPIQQHTKGTRVVEVHPSLVNKVGYPDFAEVYYGLTSPGGDVFAAELQGGVLKEMLYPPVQTNTGTPGPHPKAGQTKVIGRVALKEPTRTRACRVLVMGGRAEERADFVRWYGNVDDFEFDLEEQALQREVDKLRKAMNEEELTAVKKAALAEAVESALGKKSDLGMCFKVVASFKDSAREDALASLRQTLAEKEKDDDDASSAAGGRAMTVMTLSSSVAGGEEEEFAGNAGAREAHEEVKRLREQVDRFRHRQGFYAPITGIVKQALGTTLKQDWGVLEKKEALCVLYHGVYGGSPLSRIGTLEDFQKLVTTKIKATRPQVDASHFFRAEVLLSVPDKQPSVRRTPDCLILIDAPDIIRQSSDKPGEEDAVVGLAERLLPRLGDLMAAMHRFDEDGTNSIDLHEFAKAVDSLRLDPPLARVDVQRIFARLDPDGGGSIEYSDLPLLWDDRDDARPCPYDQEAAFDLAADLADVVVLLLDAKSSRFNASELAIVKRIHAKHKGKMHFCCAENHAQRDALGRVLAHALSDRSLEAIPCMSTEGAQALALVNAAINAQQNQVVSLLTGFRSNMDSLHKRLQRVYSHLGNTSSLVVLDPSAVATANQLIVKACQSGARRISKESGLLLLEFKAACKAFRKASSAILARSNIRPLSYEDRVAQWRKDEVERLAAERAVREFDVASWMTPRHIAAWLLSIEVEKEARDIMEREKVTSVHDLLRVSEVRMLRWGVPVGDRLRVLVGMDRVRAAFAERRLAYLSEALWRLLATEPPNNEEVKVVITPDMLQDQGPDTAVKPGGLKAGQRTVVDVATHGRLVVEVPTRAELEAKNWEVKFKRMQGLDAYISPYDLSVMLAVLKGDVECSAASKALLEDGLHLFLVGDVPAQLVAEVIAGLKAEFEDVLGYHGQGSGDLPDAARAYQRRWQLEKAAAEEAGGSDDSLSSSDEEVLDKAEVLQRAAERVAKCFAVASGGDIVAEGAALEEAVRGDGKLLKLLDRAGTDMKLGSVRIFRDRDVLKSELMRALLGNWDGDGAGASDSDD